MELAADIRQTAGILLIAIVAVEWGGWHLLRVVRGTVARTEFQEKFERAGHAHAAVFLVLALVALLYADAIGTSGPVGWIARNGVPIAAILMPAGFFFSAAGRGRTAPNRFIILIYLGLVSLTLGVVALGVSLLTSL